MAQPEERRLFLPPRPVIHVTGALEHELITAITALSGYRQLCYQAFLIHGPVGAGKTSLVRALADHPLTRRTFRDGVAWVESARNPNETVMRLCLGFELERAPGERWVECWRRWIGLEERRVLLIVDNVRDPRGLTSLVSGLGPQVTVFVTTRKRIAVLAELERWLPARAIRQVEVSGLSPEEAAALATTVMGRKLDIEESVHVQKIGNRVRWRPEAIRCEVIKARETGWPRETSGSREQSST